VPKVISQIQRFAVFQCLNFGHFEKNFHSFRSQQGGCDISDSASQQGVFMKFSLLAFLLVFSFSSAFASNSKIFSKTKKGADADYPCVYAAGGHCSTEEMEAELTSKCYEKGFALCETLVKKRFITKSGFDMFCGSWSRTKCIVTVKGSFE
jgi:hypothetical protein